MLENRINIFDVEKIELLPDEMDIFVSRAWCFYVSSQLTIAKVNNDLLDIINSYIYANIRNTRPLTYVSKYVKMQVYHLKKLIGVCNNENFSCCLPLNYDDIINEFVYTKLGNNKHLIDSLIIDNNVDEVFSFVENIEDKSIKRIALIYAKHVHSLETDRKIMDLNIARKRIFGKINSMLH